MGGRTLFLVVCEEVFRRDWHLHWWTEWNRLMVLLKVGGDHLKHRGSEWNRMSEEGQKGSLHELRHPFFPALCASDSRVL